MDKELFDYIINLRDGYKDLQERYDRVCEINQMCNKKIDKAIEYIQNRIEDINNGGNEHDYRNLNEILNILEGKDVEYE